MMASYAKRFAVILTTNIAIISIVYLTLIVLNKTDLLPQFTGLYFDSYHYQSIAETGYNGFLVAFFPFFPLVWKLFSLTPLTACIFNLITFSGGYALLGQHLKTNNLQQLVYQLLPSFAFFFLPYSEALFFFFSTLILIGVTKGNNLYLISGLFLCSLTRPIAFVFIPAFFLYYWFNNGNTKERLISFSKCIVPIFIGLFIVFLIQRLQTGEWLTFFKVQEEGWGNKISIPDLPLTSWGGNFMSLYDGLTLWFCMIFGIMSLRTIVQKNSNSIQVSSLDNAAQLSMLILAGTGLMILFTRGGLLFSLNRFVVASPFFIVAIHHVLQQNKITKKQALYIALSIVLFSTFLGSYNHIRHICMYLGISLFLLFQLIAINSKKLISNIAFSLMLALLLTVQVYFFYRVLTEQWIG
jgi:hypothetical protein